MQFVREGRGWMFLSGLLFGMGVMLIFLTATADPKTKTVWPTQDCGPACQELLDDDTDGIDT
jgi:hypothetical protein